MTINKALGLGLLCGALGAGCVTQRSLALGQLASAVGRGGADLSVSTGVMYQSASAPPVGSKDAAGMDLTNQLTTRGFSIPWFEANLDYGLSDRVGINAHLSPAGLQPGAKITLNKSRVASIALLPQLGIGYSSYAQDSRFAGSNGILMDAGASWTTLFIFTAGLKVLFSHQVGFYAGVGYDLYVHRSVDNQRTGGNTTVNLQVATNGIQHQLIGSVGFNIAVGMVGIRPELSLAIIPVIEGNRVAGMNPAFSAGGGSGWAFLGGFAFALTTPPTKRDRGAEEDEKNVGGEEEKADEDDRPPREREREREPPPERDRDSEEDPQ